MTEWVGMIWVSRKPAASNSCCYSTAVRTRPPTVTSRLRKGVGGQSRQTHGTLQSLPPAFPLMPLQYCHTYNIFDCIEESLRAMR